MKVLAVHGSPVPKGNSSLLSNHFCETAEKLGAQVESHHLNKLNYKGCQGCHTCKFKLDHCVLDDGVTPIINSMADSDVVVLSTPVYMFEMSGQLKLFLDRLYSLAGPNWASDPSDIRLPAGKSLLFIQAQENPGADAYPQIFKDVDELFSIMRL
jgi:multimeric flavodoxin WrbA